MDPNSRVIQKDAAVVDNTSASVDSPEQNFQQEQTQEVPAEVQPQAQDSAPAVEGEAGAEAEGAEAGSKNAQGYNPDDIASAVLARMEQQNAAKLEADKQPEELAQEEQLAQQKAQILEQGQQYVGQFDQQRTELQKKFEEGDVDITNYVAQMNALTEQKSQAQREVDMQVMAIDSELQLFNRQKQQEIQSARKEYVSSNPDFEELYNSGKFKELSGDPKIRSVFGDNPAAIHQVYKNQQLSQENTQLKEQLAQFKAQMENTIKNGAAAPNAKVGTSTGTTRPQSSGKSGNPTDSMMAAIQRARGAA